MPRDNLFPSAVLVEVAATLDRVADRCRYNTALAWRGAKALRGERSAVEAIGGEPARARLVTLATRMMARPGHAAAPRAVARFFSQTSPYLQEPPLELVRTVVGAEQVRRLVSLEPPLPPPASDRTARAAELDDLDPEEAYVAYAEGHIASPRLMAITGLRSIGHIMAALTQRNLQLPSKPSPVAPGRDDRDLLWEQMGGRNDIALQEPVPVHHLRPAPPPSPDLDAAWPLVVPDDPEIQGVLATLAVAFDAKAAEHEREAARARRAAEGLRGDAAAVGGEAARARLVSWVTDIFNQAEKRGGQDQAFAAWSAVWFMLQPLLRATPPYDPIADGRGALELACTEEGAALVDNWRTSRPSPDPVRVVAATDLGDLTPDEAYAAYADGRIDSRRLTAIVGCDAGDLFEIWGQLALRGLKLPVAPTYVGPHRDDRDLLWEALARRAESRPVSGTAGVGGEG